MKFRNVVFLVLALFAGIASRAQTPQQSDNIVILWNNTAIEAARDTNSGGLVTVRALAMMHTAMFDAWTQYDAIARPTLGTALRRPASERMIENEREAISYAAYRTLVDLFPTDIAKLARQTSSHKSLLPVLSTTSFPEAAGPAAPKAIGRLIFLATNFAEFFAELCAERTPKTTFASSLLR